MAKLWKYWINPIYLLLGLSCILGHSFKPFFKILLFKIFLSLLILVFLQTLNGQTTHTILYDILPRKIISCPAFTLGVPHPLSTSSDTVHLEAWLYLEICGSGEAVIRSLTYYVIEEQRVKEAGKELSIRVNKKADTVLSVMFNAEIISQRFENIISAVISVISQRICYLPRKVTNYIL